MEKSIDNIEESKFWTQWPNPGRKTAGWGILVSRLGPDLNDSFRMSQYEGELVMVIKMIRFIGISRSVFFHGEEPQLMKTMSKIELFFDENS